MAYVPYYKHELNDIDYSREAFEDLPLADKIKMGRCAGELRVKIQKGSGILLTIDEALALLWKIGREINESEEPKKVKNRRKSYRCRG